MNPGESGVDTDVTVPRPYRGSPLIPRVQDDPRLFEFLSNIRIRSISQALVSAMASTAAATDSQKSLGSAKVMLPSKLYNDEMILAVSFAEEGANPRAARARRVEIRVEAVCLGDSREYFHV